MKYCLYMHNGSGNHGCEALVRTTCELLGEKSITLFSKNPVQDMEAGLTELCSIEKQGRSYTPGGFVHACLKLSSAPWSHSVPYVLYQYGDFIKRIPEYDLFLSIGGDNYCYPRYPDFLAYLNKKITNAGKKSVLWGCSIEPDLLRKKSVVEDLKRYDLITARESITYAALLDAGVTKNTHLYPDSAFALQEQKTPLPSPLFDKKVIGINVSPLVQRLACEEDIVLENYRCLIQYILKNTQCNIALIPHVLLPYNDDRVPLKLLYDQFCKSGRITLISGNNAAELKGIIGACHMFVGARTHAVIAAYSSCVPALAVGYSIKAKGIAKDIFGLWEPYVTDVFSFKQKENLTEAFCKVYNNKDKMKEILEEKIPEIINRVQTAPEAIYKLTGAKL